jgi:hypothetical protein
MCAFGAHDGNFDIEVCEVNKKVLKNKIVIKARIHSALLHLDWSKDSNNIVINT